MKNVARNIVSKIIIEIFTRHTTKYNSGPSIRRHFHHVDAETVRENIALDATIMFPFCFDLPI